LSFLLNSNKIERFINDSILVILKANKMTKTIKKSEFNRLYKDKGFPSLEGTIDSILERNGKIYATRVKHSGKRFFKDERVTLLFDEVTHLPVRTQFEVGDYIKVILYANEYTPPRLILNETTGITYQFQTRRYNK